MESRDNSYCGWCCSLIFIGDNLGWGGSSAALAHRLADLSTFVHSYSITPFKPLAIALFRPLATTPLRFFAITISQFFIIALLSRFCIVAHFFTFPVIAHAISECLPIPALASSLHVEVLTVIALSLDFLDLLRIV
jgi:hypothetical protein